MRTCLGYGHIVLVSTSARNSRISSPTVLVLHCSYNILQLFVHAFAFFAMGRLLLNYHHRRSSFIIFLVYATSLIVSFTNASSSFPATIQSVDNSFWQTDESSSDWEWDEEDDDRGSSDGSTLSEEEMDSSATDFSSENTTATVTATRRLHQQNKNKPLETLEKLQQMLDETDYMTTTSTSSLQPSSSSTNSLHEHKNKDEKQLWTSKDRSKYKKQQKIREEQFIFKDREAQEIFKNILNNFYFFIIYSNIINNYFGSFNIKATNRIINCR